MHAIGSGLRNKKVLITGASGDIGSEMARFFAGHGACVGIHYHASRNRAQQLQREIKKNWKVRTDLFAADLCGTKACKRVVQDFIKVFGAIDVLINNAGAVAEYKDFSLLSETSWDNTFALNAKAPFFLTGAAFEHMKGKGGRIINISSVNVKYGGSGKSLHYNASKAASES